MSKFAASLPVLPALTRLEGADAGLWGVAICRALKAPVTLDNVYTFAGWFAEEGGGGENNPMNSTEGNYPDTPGSWNVDHVKDYPTPQIGVAETVATLQNGYYPAIVAAFRAGVGLGHPGASAAAELGEWSGGGYHALPQVIVPMPPAPLTYHYEWFDASAKLKLPTSRNTERAVVRNYDKQRKQPELYAESLRKIRENLTALADRVEHVMQQQDPEGKRYHRKWRLGQLRERAADKVVSPVPGTWPQS